MQWTFLSVATFLHIVGLQCFAQAIVHEISAINPLPDRTISIELGGNPSSLFKPYFDIYLLDSSKDLIHWAPLMALLRTNKSTAPLVYSDPTALDSSVRFYRTFTNHLVTPLPIPTGPYTVGTTSYLLTDPSRTNRYNVKTNSSFMITLWFPGTPMPGLSLAPYVEYKLAPRLAGLYGISQNVLSNFFSHSLTGNLVATNEAPYPVVIYSHGFNVSRRDNTAKFEELASHGYVVASIDHADCLQTVFPDGRVLTSSISSLSAGLFANDLKDVQFVLETLTRMNEEDPIFKGALDMTRVGTMGWSYGGGVAAEVCRMDHRILATVLLEAYFQNADDLVRAGLDKPSLGVYQTGGSKTLFNKTTHDSYFLTFKNTAHQNFSDWLAWVAGPNDTGRKAAVAMDQCMLSFFNKYLKNQDDHLLDNPTSIFPQIGEFLKK